jgi:hypothetical protein
MFLVSSIRPTKCLSNLKESLITTAWPTRPKQNPASFSTYHVHPQPHCTTIKEGREEICGEVMWPHGSIRSAPTIGKGSLLVPKIFPRIHDQRDIAYRVLCELSRYPQTDLLSGTRELRFRRMRFPSKLRRGNRKMDRYICTRSDFPGIETKLETRTETENVRALFLRGADDG